MVSDVWNGLCTSGPSDLTTSGSSANSPDGCRADIRSVLDCNEEITGDLQNRTPCPPQEVAKKGKRMKIP